MQKAKKHPRCTCWTIALVTIVNQIIYTALTFAVGGLLFPVVGQIAEQSDHFILHIAMNSLIECTVFSTAMLIVCQVPKLRRVQYFINNCREGIEKVSIRQANLYILFSFLVFALFTSGGLGQYLGMSKKALSLSPVTLDSHTTITLKQLAFQQMLANLALFIMMIVLVMLAYYYSVEHRHKLLFRADQDLMTGLYNRETAKDKIRAHCELHPKMPRCSMMVDVDGLKTINDTLGHAAGDDAIMGVANALKETFRSTEIVGRMGGDEFIVFIEDVATREELTPILNQFQDAVAQMQVLGNTGLLHVSIGVRLDPHGTATLDDLYRDADEALYSVKKNGKNDIAYYCDLHGKKCR